MKHTTLVFLFFFLGLFIGTLVQIIVQKPATQSAVYISDCNIHWDGTRIDFSSVLQNTPCTLTVQPKVIWWFQPEQGEYIAATASRMFDQDALPTSTEWSCANFTIGYLRKKCVSVGGVLGDNNNACYVASRDGIYSGSSVDYLPDDIVTTTIQTLGTTTPQSLGYSDCWQIN